MCDDWCSGYNSKIRVSVYLFYVSFIQIHSFSLRFMKFYTRDPQNKKKDTVQVLEILNKRPYSRSRPLNIFLVCFNNILYVLRLKNEENISNNFRFKNAFEQFIDRYFFNKMQST